MMEKVLESIKINDIYIKNRIVMPPMCMYASLNKDGKLTPFHFAHYLTRAMGGVGLIILESTGVSPEARITDSDLGIWHDDFIKDFKVLVDQMHQYQTTVGLQINHAGRKSRIIPTLAPSKIAFGDYKEPNELTMEEIKDIICDFGKAAKRADEAGFDYLEIHGAHGYLINQFTSPLTNKRTDIYKAGPKFLFDIVDEVKKYWPNHKILALRISAFEYSDNGLTPLMWVDYLNELTLKIDLVNVSSGGVILTKINDYPGYQLDYAKQIKENTKLKVLAGGLIDNLSDAEKTLKNNDADFIYFGRKLLREPFFLLNETNIEWPINYIRAKK